MLAETSEEVLRAVTSDWQLRLPASVLGHSRREERGTVLEGPGRRTERRAGATVSAEGGGQRLGGEARRGSCARSERGSGGTHCPMLEWLWC